MELTPNELDRLLIFNVAALAQSRRSRGVKLNKPEAVALISNAVLEAAREGASHSAALAAGLCAVTESDLIPGIGPLLTGIAVEAVFDDGRRLVVVDFASSESDTPGKVTRLVPLPKKISDDIVTITVVNESDIQISITTHMHFFEANPKLRFDRDASYGRHLQIPAGEHTDFPPATEINVNLVPISGNRVLIGFAGLVDGPLDAPGAKNKAIAKAISLGYLGFEK